MPSKKRKTSVTEVEDKNSSQTEQNFWNLHGRLIVWLENPNNFRTFQLYLTFQSVALSILYSWWQYQFPELQ
jgi:hypothetical protein